jgi:hypothetical protein
MTMNHQQQQQPSSMYWASQARTCGARDLGHLCKECKQPFSQLGEPLTVRRGGRIELRYHSSCFSGAADPRSQPSSSFNTTTHQLSGSAPKAAFHKMRTTSQF